MAEDLQLPIIDLAKSDRAASARSIRQACMKCGFFYLINHGVEESLFQKVLEGNKMFFSLPLEEKMKLARKNHRGYTPLYAGNLDPSAGSREVLPGWSSIMEDYYERVMNAGKRLVKLVALALNLDENFFYDVGAFNPPDGFLRLLRYPGELGSSHEEIYGAAAHRSKKPLSIVLFLCCHIVQVNLASSNERYSVAFFFDPNPDCVVECLKSCCNESAPPRFPPIRAGDYLEKRFKVTYGA